MDASINTAKVALKQEIARLTGVLGHLNATLTHLESLSPTELAGLPATRASISTMPTRPVAALVAAPVSAPVAALPSLASVSESAAPAASAVKLAASRLYSAPPAKPASPDDSEKLHRDVDAWMPKLTRVPLADLYLAATLDRPQHLPQLPSSVDMDNAEVRRIMGNYLRHTEVIGYRDFCARLKQFTGLSHLYKRVRDKATAAINTAYPELAGGTYTFPVNGQKQAPSGATQFAALATLLPTAAPAATASA